MNSLKAESNAIKFIKKYLSEYVTLGVTPFRFRRVHVLFFVIFKCYIDQTDHGKKIHVFFSF